MNLGATPISAIIFMITISIFWFFGIHPNTILSIYLPVLMATGVANLTAFMEGEPMPHLAFSAVMAFYALGGAGNTLGISLLIPFISKSQRYKTLGKLSLAPAIFNINEPLVFGLPLMLNPIFFIPMVSTSLVNGIIGIIGYNLGVYDTLNPSISLPWIMPAFIGPILTIGIKGVIAVVIAICINGLIYLPFFLKADKLALAEEQALEDEVMAEKVTEAV
ncbi:Phosphotransferase system cellobiose-specific component IIC [Enterococcus casseliflavus]|nr:Phosphotransferase system cellobiose-specific component IIC [Enterococcus casseliflavus]